MAQIEVEAAAHVLGMKPGTRAWFEDTPFLRGAIKGGTLRLVEATELENLEPQVLEVSPTDVDEREAQAYDEAFEALEAISRARHPAGKKLAAAAVPPGEAP
jgi:hypothetical protein